MSSTLKHGAKEEEEKAKIKAVLLVLKSCKLMHYFFPGCGVIFGSNLQFYMELKIHICMWCDGFVFISLPRPMNQCLLFTEKIVKSVPFQMQRQVG